MSRAKSVINQLREKKPLPEGTARMIVKVLDGSGNRVAERVKKMDSSAEVSVKKSKKDGEAVMVVSKLALDDLRLIPEVIDGFEARERQEDDR